MKSKRYSTNRWNTDGNVVFFDDFTTYASVNNVLQVH